MKKIMVLTFAMVFAISAISVYACDNDNGSAKAKSSASKDVKQIQASMNSAEGKVQTAQATVDAPACDVAKTDQTSAAMEMNSGQAKVMNADVKTAIADCPVTTACPASCCKDGKNAKASAAEIKASDDMKTVVMKVDDKKESK